MDFILGDPDGDYYDGPMPNQDYLWRALRLMLHRMRDELWGYLGISAVAGGEWTNWNHTQFLRITGDSTAALAAARSQVEQGVRRRLLGRPENEIRAELQRSLAKWETARSRMIDLLNLSRNTVLGTLSRSPNSGPTLLSWETRIPLMGLNQIVVNPFTYFLADGLYAIRFSSERARAANSATMHLLHEGGHHYGTPLVTAGNSANFGSDCTAIARDIDAAVVDHIGIAQRRGARGWPGERTYLDSDSPNDRSLSVPARSGTEWVEWPTSMQLKKGVR